MWSSEQTKAIDSCARWMRSDRQLFRLFGYAGTGKTTLAKTLTDESDGIWLFAAPTGRAASVLRSKGCDGASTIHSLIYKPAGSAQDRAQRVAQHKLQILQSVATTRELTPEEVKLVNELEAKLREPDKMRFSVREVNPMRDPDVVGVVVDEASMIGEYVARDLMSFGKKILALGDPAQLPPVAGGGFLIDGDPDILLTQVHRQEYGSSIIDLATDIRSGKYALRSDREVEIVTARDKKRVTDLIVSCDQILCGTNARRTGLNRYVRKLIGRKSVVPEEGERIICLRNNEDLYNGSQWYVRGVMHDAVADSVSMTLESDDDSGDERVVSAWTHHFTGHADDLKSMHRDDRNGMDEFDFAYAVTVHKAQGSQWDHVVVFDESRVFKNAKHRWLYTAVTRAAKRLTVVTL